MRILLLALILAVWGAGAPRLLATRMMPLSLEELARQAGAVVHGRVVSVEAARDAAGRILTRIEVAPLEVWKGHVDGGPVKVVAGGGVLGDRAVTVSGQAQYAVGDEVVAFLVRNPAGEWVTLGLGQGRFDVRVEAATGRRWVSNLFWGDRGATGGALALHGTENPRAALSLEELKRRTREVAP